VLVTGSVLPEDSDIPTAVRRPGVRGGTVGVAAAACAVCCAAPVLSLLGIGLTGAAAVALTAAFTVAFAGLAFGLVVVVATVAAVLVRRRRARATACSPALGGPVQIELGRSPERP